jgi:hypothetical protein
MQVYQLTPDGSKWVKGKAIKGKLRIKLLNNDNTLKGIGEYDTDLHLLSAIK